MNPKRLYLVLVAALVPCSLALIEPRAGAQGPLADERSPETTNESLERALASIQADNIRSDLYFIASDELAGRDTPSSGLRKAARYIRARLERLGFTPAGSAEGSYFHDYKMVRGRLDRERTSASIAEGGSTLELEFGEDYYFWPGGVANVDASGDVVFAGGASLEDVARMDLRGKWVFAYDGQDVGLSDLEKSARAAGAIGLVVASPPGSEDEHGARRARRLAQWVGGGGAMRVVTAKDEREGVFPQLFVSAKTAASLRAVVGDSPAPGESMKVKLSDLRAITADSETIDLENVAGLWPGADPELRGEVIIVSAHYDHVGVDGDDIYNGADDNGSGTCGMMAIAEALGAHGPMKRSVLLLWVSGEEKGLKGSEAWTKDPTLPAGMRAVCNLNIDMIGRNAPDYLLITPTKKHPAYNGLTRMAEKVGPLEGFPELGSCDEYWMRSDHMNFSVNMGIPVAFLFSDVHADYHQPSDTVEKIDYDKIARVSRMVVRMLDELQDLDLELL